MAGNPHVRFDEGRGVNPAPALLSFVVSLDFFDLGVSHASKNGKTEVTLEPSPPKSEPVIELAKAA
jgi:hypothetical protein